MQIHVVRHTLQSGTGPFTAFTHADSCSDRYITSHNLSDTGHISHILPFTHLLVQIHVARCTLQC